MAKGFSAGAAAFDAFKKRERRGVLTRAVAAYAGVSLAIGLSFLALSLQGMIDYFRWAEELADGITPPPPGVMQLLGVWAIVTPLSIALLAALEAACLRWLTRGEAGGGLLGLKLDGAFWLVLFCYLTWFPIVIGNGLLAAIIASVGIYAGGAAGGGVTGFLIGFFSISVALALYVIVAVKLAPAAALSVARGRYAFFEAWGATKGRTLSLFGAFLIILALAALAAIVVAVAGLGVNQRFTELMATVETSADLLAAGGVLLPLLALTVVNTVVQLVTLVAMYGANAALARAATPSTAADDAGEAAAIVL